jgi:hypothetical protein
MLTLKEAAASGVLPWGYHAARQRLQRGVGILPESHGKKGNANLYIRADLARWVESANPESVT